jgi:hypothetical protein
MVGEGKVLSNAIAPDIAVDTSLEDERAYLQDPYKDLHPSETVQVDAGKSSPPEPRPRFNEAELVREHNAGQDADDDESGNPAPVPVPVMAEPGPPAVADPALGRALDLLKSLAVMEPNRPG